MLDTDMQEILMSDYLRVPTPILQMQQVLKNPSAYGCLQFIWAKTGGWLKGKDTLSYSQFKNDERYGTGLSEKTIQRAVEKLAELGVINTKPSFGRMYEFSINLEKVVELVADLKAEKTAKVRSNSPDPSNSSPVILSSYAVNLSASPVILSSKSGQIDLHTIPFTLDFYTKKIKAQKDISVSQSKKSDSDTKKKPQSKTKTATKKKPTFSANEYPIPDFIQKEVWIAYNDMRVTKKKPATEYACKLLVERLTEWHNAGLDIHQSIKKSIVEMWTDVYQPKTRINQAAQSPASRQRTTPDPLAVNAKYDVPTEMTDEEKRAWFADSTDSTMPSDTASDNDNNYYG
ncbi:hypothetical protein [Psychrobacter sp. MES7-P7E]|uniref:hypothetical protein n=1 Tax=Psychrobacter sp. MES7-P7E TaxID=2058322 RepID=UPI000C7F1A85|nr:hypothetical protein [Psychrobacter sp. MES7-P7E]PLT21123.1 hypothetical protein CXF62_11515 [Psychrobacter sp. MES7-P7E]